MRIPSCHSFCWLAATLAVALVQALAPALVEAAAAPARAERDEIAALRREVARHDALYFQQAEPEISDSEYDQLKRRLAGLEARNPGAGAVAAAPPELADDRSGRFPSYRHRERMMSLTKAYTETELREFHAGLAKHLGRDDLVYVVEPKYDGLAVSITFENGRLIRAVTRGNGVEGEDITANVRQISNLPPAFAALASDAEAMARPRLVELRGEIYVPLAAFARLNAEREAAGESLFANPRNLAAGTIRQLDSRDVSARGLQVVFFGVGACEPAEAMPPTQREFQRQLRAWGLPGVVEAWVARSADELVRAVTAVARARPTFAFPIDGAVAKLDSLPLQRDAGAGEIAPRWAIAFKFAAERAETRLRAITLQVGRTGVLTPVAELAPVELGGSTISRATLHNADEIARKDIRVGDFVVVEKAGEIIPAIVAVDRERRPPGLQPFVFPSRCPECAQPVRRNQGEAAFRCENGGCPAQLRRRIEHFASKPCVDIKGLGPTTIAALVGSGAVKDLPDLYRLRRDDLAAAFGRNGSKSADQLLSALEASKRAELWRFIHGLGIPQVGAAGAHELAREAGGLAALVSMSVRANGESLGDAASAESGARRAAAAFFAEARNRALIEGLVAAGVRPAVNGRTSTASALAGKTLVLTGTLPTLTRAQATAKIEAAGGKISGAVSRTTHYVVAGSEPGAKLEQARKLGVKVIDEAELRRLLEAP